VILTVDPCIVIATIAESLGPVDREFVSERLRFVCQRRIPRGDAICAAAGVLIVF
jgi:hypothetical protein